MRFQDGMSFVLLAVFLLLAMLLTSSCAPGVFGLLSALDPDAEVAFQKRKEHELRLSLDFQICTSNPKLRPVCLFDENNERREQLYKTDQRYAEPRQELLDLYGDELDQEIDKMVQSGKLTEDVR